MGSSTSITHTNPSLMVERKHKRQSAHHHHNNEKLSSHYATNVTQSLNLSIAPSSPSSSSSKHSKYIHNSVDDLSLSTNKPLQSNTQQQYSNTHRLQHLNDDNYHSSPNNLQHTSHHPHREQQQQQHDDQINSPSRITSPSLKTTRFPTTLNSPTTPTNKKSLPFTPTPTIIESSPTAADISRRGHVVLPQIQVANPQPSLTNSSNTQSDNSIPRNSKDHSNSAKLTTALINETCLSENTPNPPEPFQNSQKGSSNIPSSSSVTTKNPLPSSNKQESFTPIVAFTPLDDIEDDSKAIYMHPYHGNLPPLSPSNSTCSSKTSSSNCSSTLSSPKEKIASPKSSSSTSSGNPALPQQIASASSSTSTTASSSLAVNNSACTSNNISQVNASPTTTKPIIEVSKVSNNSPIASSPISKDQIKKARPRSAAKNSLSQSLHLEKFKDDSIIGRKSKSNIISDNSVKVPSGNALARSFEEPFKLATSGGKTKKRSTSVNSRNGSTPKRSSIFADDDDMVMMDMPPAIFNRFELQKQFMDTEKKSKEMKIDLKSSVNLDNHRDVLTMFSSKHHSHQKEKNLSPITSPTKLNSGKGQEDFENLGNEDIRIIITPPTFLPDLSHLNLTHLQLRMLSNERSQKRKMARSIKRESACSLNGISLE